MKKENSRFRTHIAESRWQQILSVTIVLILATIELLFIFNIF